MMKASSPYDGVQLLSRADARASGIDVRTLRGPRFKRLFHDIYVPAVVPITPMLRARAALKIAPTGSHTSHFTAAEIWGAWVPEQPLTHLSVPDGASRTERRGVRGHVTNPNAEVVRHRGLPVSSPAQTFLDLAGPLDLVDLVVLGDSLVRSGLTTPLELIDVTERWSGHGARLARRAARFVREGVDSPMESRLRMLIVLARIPEPQVNFVIRGEAGEWQLRFDLCYPSLKLIIEYDGRQHAEDDAQWDRDIARREELDRLGWRLVIVRSTGIYVEPEQTLQRIVTALRERGCRDLPGKLHEEWRRHFPERTR